MLIKFCLKHIDVMYDCLLWTPLTILLSRAFVCSVVSMSKTFVSKRVMSWKPWRQWKFRGHEGSQWAGSDISKHFKMRYDVVLMKNIHDKEHTHFRTEQQLSHDECEGLLLPSLEPPRGFSYVTITLDVHSCWICCCSVLLLCPR